MHSSSTASTTALLCNHLHTPCPESPRLRKRRFCVHWITIFHSLPSSCHSVLCLWIWLIFEPYISGLILHLCYSCLFISSLLHLYNNLKFVSEFPSIWRLLFHCMHRPLWYFSIHSSGKTCVVSLWWPWTILWTLVTGHFFESLLLFLGSIFTEVQLLANPVCGVLWQERISVFSFPLPIPPLLSNLSLHSRHC